MTQGPRIQPRKGRPGSFRSIDGLIPFFLDLPQGVPEPEPDASDAGLIDNFDKKHARDSEFKAV